MLLVTMKSRYARAAHHHAERGRDLEKQLVHDQTRLARRPRRHPPASRAHSNPPQPRPNPKATRCNARKQGGRFRLFPFGFSCTAFPRVSDSPLLKSPEGNLVRVRIPAPAPRNFNKLVWCSTGAAEPQQLRSTAVLQSLAISAPFRPAIASDPNAFLVAAVSVEHACESARSRPRSHRPPHRSRGGPSRHPPRQRRPAARHGPSRRVAATSRCVEGDLRAGGASVSRRTKRER